MKKIIIITALCAALFVTFALVLPSLSVDTEPIDNSSASDISDDSAPVVSTPSQPDESTVSEDISLDESQPDDVDIYELAIQDILLNKSNLKTSFAESVDRAFIENVGALFGVESVVALSDALAVGEVNASNIREIFGYSEKAFCSLVTNDLERTTVIESNGSDTAEFVFVGDVSFADGYSVMSRYESRGKGAAGIVSEEVLAIMRNADVAMANNEFTLSDRGSPIPDKLWTFRGKPENVSIYHEMGVDIVGLANNHVFDYGPDALTDTLATLDGAAIARVGAGENIDEAKAPYYYIVNGYKIAVVAGSAIDPYSTRGATDKQSGVFQIFDTDSMCQAIIDAKEEADFVIAYVHWGHESTTELTGGQKRMGKAFVDAGADLVVGMHSHCMQGLEYYNGKLIVYSLGNFTFSSYTLTAGMLQTTISSDGEFTNKFYTLMNDGNFTYINDGEKGKSQLEELRSISTNINITEDFLVTDPSKKEDSE